MFNKKPVIEYKTEIQKAADKAKEAQILIEQAVKAYEHSIDTLALRHSVIVSQIERLQAELIEVNETFDAYKQAVAKLKQEDIQ